MVWFARVERLWIGPSPAPSYFGLTPTVGAAYAIWRHLRAGPARSRLKENAVANIRSPPVADMSSFRFRSPLAWKTGVRSIQLPDTSGTLRPAISGTPDTPGTIAGLSPIVITIPRTKSLIFQRFHPSTPSPARHR